jgi:uncharacterized protein YjbI with pentapeptide repeats
MKLLQVTEALDANDANLCGSAFSDVDLSGSSFNQVHLSGATFNDSNMTGMTINGVPVKDLFDAYEAVR